MKSSKKNIKNANSAKDYTPQKEKFVSCVRSIMPGSRSKRWHVKVKGNMKRNYRGLRKNKHLIKEQINEEL
tara:strand:- start:4140 stop:4352 length:213 start_codon:yes stop_codon:yes gene_type:complete